MGSSEAWLEDAATKETFELPGGHIDKQPSLLALSIKLLAAAATNWKDTLRSL